MTSLTRSEIEEILREELRQARIEFDTSETAFRELSFQVSASIPFDASVHQLKMAGTDRNRGVAAFRNALTRWNNLILDGTVPPELS